MTPRRILLLLAVLLAAGGVALLVVPPGGGPRIVELAVNETVALDGDGHDLLRLVAVARDTAGRATLFFEPEAGRGGRVVLGPGRPTLHNRRRLTLLGVRQDPARGSAIQLQWVPADTAAARPLFSVSGEPVDLPVTDSPFQVEIVGTIPPPGAEPVRLRARDGRRTLAEAAVHPGGELVVGTLGRLRWLGTRERLVARVEVGPGGSPIRRS